MRHSLVFPQPVLELRKKRQRVVAQDLPADLERVLFEQIAAVDPLGQDLGQAAAGHLGGAVNALGMVGVGRPT